MAIGRVYRICVDEKYTNEIYIGSTFDTLEERFRKHKSDLSSSSILFEKFGYENCHIELIKDYDVIDREHLEAYETLWINKYRNKCVNQRTPFSIRKLYRKAYREANRDTILEQQKAHYDANKDKLLEKAKVYREANRNTILERHKAYKKQPWTCEICNVTMRTGNKSKHLKTKKHLNNLSREQ